VRAGLAGLLHFPWLRSHDFYAAHFAAALVLPKAIAPALWAGDPADCFAGVFGEYYPRNQQIVDQGAELEEIQRLCADRCERELKNRNGLYNLIFWDSHRRSLVVANDMSGALLIFQAALPGGAVWCSEPGPLFALTELSAEIDVGAVEDLLCLGFQPDNRTARKAVSVFPPASALRVRLPAGRIERCIDTGDQLMAEDIVEEYDRSFPLVFREAVALRLSGRSPVRLPLSGGEDSRWILGTATELGISLTAHTLNGCQTGDVRVAQRVAAQLGVRHTVMPLQPRSITDDLQFLRVALASTMDWHAAAFLPLLHQLAPDATLPLGFLGGTFSGANILRTAPPDANSALGARIANGAGARSTLRAEIAGNLYGRQRKYISFLVRLAWNFGRPVCPFADRRVIRLGLSLSRSELYLQGARRAAFRRQFPELARLSSGNDHLPVDSFALRRLKSGLRGTAFSAWVRRALRLSTPNFDVERLRPLLLDVLGVLPAAQHTQLAPLAEEKSVLLGLALLPLLICHPEVRLESLGYRQP
jgi:hypothetical protein